MIFTQAYICNVHQINRVVCVVLSCIICISYLISWTWIMNDHLIIDHWSWNPNPLPIGTYIPMYAMYCIPTRMHVHDTMYLYEMLAFYSAFSSRYCSIHSYNYKYVIWVSLKLKEFNGRCHNYDYTIHIIPESLEIEEYYIAINTNK